VSGRDSYISASASALPRIFVSHDVREIPGILWLGKVLEIVKIGNEFGVIQQLLRCQVIEIGRICKALCELWEL
jgi:hypothetical protein